MQLQWKISFFVCVSDDLSIFCIMPYLWFIIVIFFW